MSKAFQNSGRFIITLLFAALFTSTHATVIYVKQNASGAGSGLSWTDAVTTVQQGISLAVFGDTIWVAAGTYKPGNFDQSLSFNLKNGVYLAGGFAGNETVFSQRNAAANITTLSGDIGTLGVANDNTYHIVTALSLNFTTYFDGFRVMDGNAQYGHPYGGGMYIDDGKVTIRNCTFINNQTFGSGAAVYMLAGTLTIDKSAFLYNTSSDGGGAVAEHMGVTKITNCVFSGNESTAGGAGALNTDGNVTIDRCVFSGNTCDGSGSAIACESLTGDCILSNSLFVGNVSHWGSVISLGYTTGTPGNVSLAVTNCTVADNNSTVAASNSSYEAAILFDYSTSYSKVLYNTIAYGNRAWREIEGISVSSIHNCLTDQTNVTGNGNLLSDPQFINPGPGSASAPFLLTGYDYHPEDVSPVIDAGTNTGTWAPYLRDLDSVLRPHGLMNDIGCYEKNYCTVNPHLTLNGDSVFCNGKTFTLSAPAGRDYTWSTGAGNQSIPVSSSGNYSVFMIDSNYCRGTATQSIHVDTPIVAISLNGNASFCEGGNVVLTAAQSTNYTWSTGSHNQSLTVSTSGTFTITATDASGCIGTGTQTTNALPASVTISGGPYACSGQTTTLTATATAGSTYQWSNNNTTSAIGVNQGGTYSVTITTGAACTASASATLTQQATVVPTVTVTSSPMVCQGQSMTFTATAANGGNSPSYLWKLNGVSAGFSGNPYVGAGLANGDLVSVQLTSNAICATPQVVTSTPVTATFYQVPPTPVITQNGNTLTSSAATNNQWYFAGTAIPGATGQSYTATQSGVYYVRTTSADGCESPVGNILQIVVNGVHEIAMKGVSVYPNPAMDVITIKTDASNAPEIAELYNGLGQLVLKQNFNGDNKTIRVGEFPAGRYMLRLLVNGTWGSVPLVKE